MSCKHIIPEFKFCINEDLDESFLPQKSDPEATGWDVKSSEDLIIKRDEYFKIRLGFRAFSPPGWWFQLNPRSSFLTKKFTHTLVGIIDETYANEVLLAGQFSPPPDIDEIQIAKGERIGQIIPIRRQEMKVTKVSTEEFEELCKTRNAVRSGGFGSTG